MAPAVEPTAAAKITSAEDATAEKFRSTQKYQDAVSVYFARKASRHLTPWFVNAGISANQATAVWGALSLFNSYVIYLAITRHYAFALAVFALYFLVVVIDCVDGEIARYRQTASPIGGKLLDGMWHKATEYSLLMAYTAAAYTVTQAPWLMPVGLVLLAGEAMHTFVYERRLTVIRVFAKSSEYINPTTPDDFYRKDEPWSEFPTRKKLNAFKGLIQYKSAYFLIALSWISADLLLGGLLLLTAYKHYAWIKLLVRTVNRPPRLDSE